MNDDLDLEKMLNDDYSAIQYNHGLVVDQAISILQLAEQNPIIKIDGTDIILNDDFTVAFKLINDLENKCSNALKTAREMILKEMQQAYMQTGGQKVQNGSVSITYKIPTVKENFDLETFKKDFPQLYEKYKIVTTVKESVLVKIKGDK